jgi:probable rRNA maturation factor
MVHVTAVNRVQVTTVGTEPPAWVTRLRKFQKRLLRRLGLTRGEVSILLCDNDAMAELNARFLGRATSTDVLAFPNGEGSWDGRERRRRRRLGDIAVSLPVMQTNARRYGVSENCELKRLLIHGTLHLMGMNHEADDGEMLRVQEQLVSRTHREKVI